MLNVETYFLILFYQIFFCYRKDADTNGTDILKDLVEGKNNDDTNYYTYLEKWAFSPGYPLITVTLQDANETDTIKLTQVRKQGERNILDIVKCFARDICLRKDLEVLHHLLCILSYLTK